MSPPYFAIEFLVHVYKYSIRVSPLRSVIAPRKTYHYKSSNAEDALSNDAWESKPLQNHYFPKLVWAKFIMNPINCAFFVDRLQILGHQREST